MNLGRKLVSMCPGCKAGLTWSRRASRHSSSFPPSRVVVVCKTTRLEYERKKNNHHLNEEELKNRLLGFGSDYETLLQRHTQHSQSLETILKFLESQGVDVRIRDRDTYCEEDVEWAETIFSAGGDGSFLWTASKVFTPDKVVVGFNTDPHASEGYLCLNSALYGSLLRTLEAVFKGEVPIYQRTRIRVEVGGNLLPVRSLNEVFIGERNPSVASYYELSSNGDSSERQKSSGVLVYTGTGSTSWAYNTNKLMADNVRKVLLLAQDGGDDPNLEELVSKVTREYNSANVFPGSEMSLAFVVREPIIRGIFAAHKTHAKAASVNVKSLSWNTELVVDGHFPYDIRRGGVAKCWLHPQDVLTTLQNPK